MASERVQRRIDRLLDLMEESADKENWPEVQRLARQVLALDPDNIDAPPFLNAADIEIGKVESLPSMDQSKPTVAELRPAAETQVETDPTSFGDGRYQVKRFLGEGGKKKVYLAHDELLDRDIAFALIKSEGLDDISRERITREAQAMGRLGSHPHIVTVLDLGETPPAGPGQAGQPYMVIELLAGGDVEGVVDDAPDHKLPLETAVKIAIETCRGLEFAHSKGIIHRDLKPGNVWLTGDGTAKIGDFGLAVALDRSRLTQQGMMVGTVSYMPPEQAMGGEVTPKADLYSLGAMLYEMVAGRPPFLGDDNIAIIGQHINTQAVAPTWHRSDCPRPLEALIMRLLAKNPDERPDNAGDVRIALEAVDLSAAKSVEQSVDETHVLDSLAGDVFVGRQAEMDQLKAALEDALSGRGRMVTLVGEPGIGKTRTAQELATYAGLRGCQVLWGRCYEEQGVPPYWPWVQAIRSYVRDALPDQLRSEMGSGAADIAEIVSDVKTQLPDLEPPTQLDSPEQARFRLFDSIAAFLKTASQRKPIVLMLDDLHWSDKPSLMFLEFLTRELAGARLLIIGTYRDVELSRQHPLAETLGELTRQRLFERVILRGLSLGDVTRFIEVSSGIVPPPTLANAVHTQTEGNPLFVTEVVRLLVQEGELTQERVRDRDSWEIRVPEGVREVIGRRLNRLSERCNETLTVAAVVGREFTLTQLDRLIDDLTQDMVLDVLEEALTARLIEELPTSVGLYQFTHALMQETLVDELSLTRRVRLHARIAETLEALYGDDAESHAAELAHHFAQAEAVLGTDKLAKYSLLAGDDALGNYAYEDAVAHFDRGLTAKEFMPMDSEKADLLFGHCKAQFAIVVRAERQPLYEILNEVFDYSVDVGAVSRAIAIAERQIETAVGMSVNFDQMFVRALELVSSGSTSAGRILANYGRMLGNALGDYGAAQDAFTRSLDIARATHDRGLEMRILAQSGLVDIRHLKFEDGADKTQRAVELSLELGDIATEFTARFNSMMALTYLGRLREAQQHVEPALNVAERFRNRQAWGDTGSAASWINYCGGNFDAIRRFTDRALALSPDWIEIIGHRVLVELESGELEKGNDYIDTLVNALKETRYENSLLNLIVAKVIVDSALITGQRRHFDVLREAMNEVSGSENTIPIYGFTLNWLSATLAMMDGDKTHLKEYYISLSPMSGIFNLTGPGVRSTDKLLGHLANMMGDTDVAEGHFKDAVEMCRASEHRPELAWTLCDYADMLTERAESVRPEPVEGQHGSTSSPQAEDDSDKATAMLDESLAISTELGMKLLMERVLSRREILKA